MEGKIGGPRSLTAANLRASCFGDADTFSHRDEREICFAPESPQGAIGVNRKTQPNVLSGSRTKDEASALAAQHLVGVHAGEPEPDADIWNLDFLW